MSYETASDIELNKRLAELLGWNICDTQYDQDSVVAINKYGYDTNLDYCNSWTDMGEVIEDIWHDLVWCTDFEEVYWEEVIREYECSKLRAAVIVAIQVLEERKNNEEDQSK